MRNRTAWLSEQRAIQPHTSPSPRPIPSALTLQEGLVRGGGGGRAGGAGGAGRLPHLAVEQLFVLGLRWWRGCVGECIRYLSTAQCPAA